MFDLVDYLNSKGFPQKYINKRSGHSGSCPFCPGGSDRFTVWINQKPPIGRTSCRICGKAEDGIAVVQHVEQCSYQEALRIIGIDTKQAKAIGRGAGRGSRKERHVFEPHEVRKPDRKWMKKAIEFTDTCHQALLHNDKVLEYLQKRGVSVDQIKQCRIGYNKPERATGTYRSRKSWGLPPEMGRKGQEKPIWFPGGIVIPITYMKDIIGIRIRKDKLREKKENSYHVIAGSEVPAMIHGKRFDRLIVVETNLDGIALGAIAGDLVGVVTLGGLSMKPHVKLHVLLKKARVVFDCLDFDQFKGDKAKRVNFSTRKWWSSEYKSIRCPVPVGKDVGEAIEQGVPMRSWVAVILEDAGIINAVDDCCEKEKTLPEKYKNFIDLASDLDINIERHDNGNGLKLIIDAVYRETRLEDIRKIEKVVYGTCEIGYKISELADGLYNINLLAKWLKQ